MDLSLIRTTQHMDLKTQFNNNKVRGCKLRFVYILQFLTFSMVCQMHNYNGERPVFSKNIYSHMNDIVFLFSI